MLKYLEPSARVSEYFRQQATLSFRPPSPVGPFDLFSSETGMLEPIAPEF
jgi:hypothetical protein